MSENFRGGERISSRRARGRGEWLFAMAMGGVYSSPVRNLKGGLLILRVDTSGGDGEKSSTGDSGGDTTGLGGAASVSNSGVDAVLR